MAKEVKGLIKDLRKLNEDLSTKEQEDLAKIIETLEKQPDRAGVVNAVSQIRKDIKDTWKKSASPADYRSPKLRDAVKKLEDIHDEDPKALGTLAKKLEESAKETLKGEFKASRNAAREALNSMSKEDKVVLGEHLKGMTRGNASEVLANAVKKGKVSDNVEAVLRHAANAAEHPDLEKFDDLHKASLKTAKRAEEATVKAAKKAAKGGAEAAIKTGEKEMGSWAKFVRGNRVLAPLLFAAGTVAAAAALPNQTRTVTGADGQQTTEDAGMGVGKMAIVGAGAVATGVTIYQGSKLAKESSAIKAALANIGKAASHAL